MEKGSEKKVNLLWTGGWDSTFRLLELATLEIVIQPYYFIHNDRGSKNIEMDRMNKILNEIGKRKEFKATILPILFVEVDEVLNNMKNPKLSDIYKELKSKYALGIQYEWFSLYCNQKKIYMELGIEKSSKSKMLQTIIKENCELKNIDNDFLFNRKVVTNKESTFYQFGRFFIFSITNYSKKDMEKIAKEKNWLDIMKLTWFCHNPINNKPCGFCNPCKDAMELEMSWRMPTISKLRYHIVKILISIKRKLIKNR